MPADERRTMSFVEFKNNMNEFASYYRRKSQKINKICAKMRAGKERKRLKDFCFREPKMITLNNLSTIFKVLNLEPVKEYKFHSSRKWRFDYAFIDQRVAVEYEGIFSTKSRHLNLTGYMKDCEKYSEAAILGWRIIRITAQMLRNGMAFDLIRRVLNVDM